METEVKGINKSSLFHPTRTPSALEIATHAVVLLENNPLFNSGYGAVFTRDGINELEASVMVSKGYKKRCVGVMGLRRVKNPIILARKMLEHGEDDLEATGMGPQAVSDDKPHRGKLDVPSAQGHTQIYGKAAEQLASQYGLELVDPSYFYTEQRWIEHQRALEREKCGLGSATWAAEEFLPQGTVGAVALDVDGVVCVATSTGGMTNKLTGRVGDTPVPGAGFWAEEWTEHGDPTGKGSWEKFTESVAMSGPSLDFVGPIKGLLADCFPSPWLYTPVNRDYPWQSDSSSKNGQVTTTRSIAGSGTGNGDSFLRVNALRTLAAMARWKPESGAEATTHVAGPGGELQRSAGDRWKRAGEGEGGIIGIECVVTRNAGGRIVGSRSDILMDYNCGGMYRAWIDNDGKAVMSVWTNGASD